MQNRQNLSISLEKNKLLFFSKNYFLFKNLYFNFEDLKYLFSTKINWKNTKKIIEFLMEKISKNKNSFFLTEKLVINNQNP